MYSSPLSKDQKVKKEPDAPPKERYKISVGTTKKILKIKGVALGLTDMKWLNRYIENKVKSRNEKQQNFPLLGCIVSY
jgi:hypothetical protein